MKCQSLGFKRGWGGVKQKTGVSHCLTVREATEEPNEFFLVYKEEKKKKTEMKVAKGAEGTWTLKEASDLHWALSHASGHIFFLVFISTPNGSDHGCFATVVS